MTVVISYAPGPEGDAAVAAARTVAAREQRAAIVVCTVPTPEAVAQAQAHADEFERAEVHPVEQGQDAVETIVDVVERTQARVLVLGLRRRSPVGKLVLGSAAQRLLLDAPCPVLCVKPDPEPTPADAHVSADSVA